MEPDKLPCGRFITIEGIDGAGKTTQIDTLMQRWQQQGKEMLRTREPGGTPLAECVREWVLHESMDALTEVLLLFAGRRDHIQKIIKPALSKGLWVLCDRFTDATFAYQGAGRNFNLQILQTLELWVQEGVQPDLTIWLDVMPRRAAQRLVLSRAPDRFEALDTEFFSRVVRGYADRETAAPDRFLRIDANQPVGDVSSALHQALTERGW